MATAQYMLVSTCIESIVHNAECILFNPTPLWLTYCYNSILQMNQLNLEGIHSLAQGHMAVGWREEIRI